MLQRDEASNPVLSAVLPSQKCHRNKTNSAWLLYYSNIATIPAQGIFVLPALTCTSWTTATCFPPWFRPTIRRAKLWAIPVNSSKVPTAICVWTRLRQNPFKTYLCHQTTPVTALWSHRACSKHYGPSWSQQAGRKTQHPCTFHTGLWLTCQKPKRILKRSSSDLYPGDGVVHKSPISNSWVQTATCETWITNANNNCPCSAAGKIKFTYLGINNFKCTKLPNIATKLSLRNSSTTLKII